MKKPKKRQFRLTESKNKALAKALEKNGDTLQDVLEDAVKHYINFSK